MTLEILQVEYYNIMVEGHIANAAELLSTIVGAGVDFHALKAIPVVSYLTGHNSLSLQKIAQR